MPITKKKALIPEIIVIKPWQEPKGKKSEPFTHSVRVFQIAFKASKDMEGVCDELKKFAVNCGFGESRATDICIATSEAMDNARKATLISGSRGKIHITAICTPGAAMIIFVEDHAGMMGAARMKFNPPHKKLAEHGRGSYIMKQMSNFMIITSYRNRKEKDIVLGFYAE